MIFSPDAFTASILTVEGIKDASALLNGPTGCKIYHSFLSDRHFPRGASHDPMAFQGEFYFGQLRVPSTYLDWEDYVEGSLEKLEKLLSTVAEKNNDLLAVINSPGASLIGDDLETALKKSGVSERCFTVDCAGFSLPAPIGFENTGLAILEHLDLKPLSRKENRVNIIGLSILHKHWEGTVAELKKLLSLLGLEVGAVLFAGTSVEELKNSSSSACNIVLFPEYGQKIAEWYRERFGIPSVLSPMGVPVGFDATEQLLREVAKCLGIDPSPALNFVRAARKSSYSKLARYHSFSGLPKGTSFSIRAEASFAYPLALWLYSYLGMVPLAVKTLPGGSPDIEASLRAFLIEKGFENAYDREPEYEKADIAFADGYTLGLLKGMGCCKAGIEICTPSEGYIDFIPKTYMGVDGTLLLLEKIINGIRSSL